MKSFPGRTIIAASFVLGAAVLLPFIYSLNSILPYQVFAWTVVVFLGLLAGISARVLLAGDHLLIRMSVAVPAYIGSLYILGYVTSGAVGLEFSPGVNDLPSLGEVLPILLGGLLLILSAWTWRLGANRKKKAAKGVKRGSVSSKQPKKKPTKRKSSSTVKKGGSGAKQRKTNVKRRSARVSASKKTKSAVKPKRKRAVRPGARSVKPKRKTGPTRRAPRKTRRRSVPAVARRGFLATQLAQMRQATGDMLNNGRRASRRAASSLSLRLNRRQVQVKPRSSAALSRRSAVARRKRITGVNVRFSGAVEHRCPYCLDEVVTSDPRGVRICPECGTRHHRDCWDMTGSCQVPHE